MNFEKKVVIVTGAGEGIGRAAAEKYGESGAYVVVADINREAGEETRDFIIKKKGKAVFIKTDVAKEEDCRRLAEETVKEYGKIDILINNAGIADAKKAGIFGEGMEEFDRVISVNLRGTFMCSKYCVPFMKPGSSIVNISSTRAFMSEPETEAYSASKGGIAALTHSMAVSLSEKNIRVNSISPGWIDVSGWKKGRKYYGCIDNPECDFMVWQRPSNVKCERCGSLMLYKGNKLVCSNESCGFVTSVPKGEAQ